MEQSSHQFDMAYNVRIGGDLPVFIAGPCVIESRGLCIDVAQRLKELTSKLGVPFIFKASFDKANRTSGQSFRSIGFEKSLEILAEVRAQIGVPVLTDVHERDHVKQVADVVDVLQIPAFLCRQTDLLEACAQVDKPVNIKKGQFMAPQDMQHAAEKIRAVGRGRVCLTERGSSFGYHNLVVDMRSLVVMRQYAPVIFDATHSVQQPGAAGGASGGQREYVSPLARAAAAVGVDGFFIETHPDPQQALSDGPNMVPLNEMEPLLRSLLAIHQAARI
ncbi:MAG: 3-deoxy-8-phosphooctulonate synthase [Candidatus Hinthialibacter antarcticus]|nr:3-deoxy-8-phosphooctulonate synthase [Candidatus Hinthialibacter antarcticus]